MFATQDCNIPTRKAKYISYMVKILSKIQMRAKVFAREYLKQNMNGTETVIKVYGTKDRKVASSIATENLGKPVFQYAIADELELSNLNRTKRLEILNRNAKQIKNYSASNQAIEIATKIAGDYAPERKESLSVSIDLTNQAQVENRLFEIQEELKKLQGTH